jgi:hypothetical protein
MPVVLCGTKAVVQRAGLVPARTDGSLCGATFLFGVGLVVDFEDSFSFSFEHILQFPVAGNYIARLAIDGRTNAQWSITVKVVPSA